MGLIFTDVKWDSNITNNGVSHDKKGEACATSVLGFATGDASLEAAMSAGGIKEVADVNHSSNGILGVYGKYCTIVRGK